MLLLPQWALLVWSFADLDLKSALCYLHANLTGGHMGMWDLV